MIRVNVIVRSIQNIYIYRLVGYWAERNCFAAKVKSLLFRARWVKINISVFLSVSAERRADRVSVIFGYLRSCRSVLQRFRPFSAMIGDVRLPMRDNRGKPIISFDYDRKWSSIIPPNRPNVQVFLEENVENAKVGQPFSQLRNKKGKKRRNEFPPVRSKYRARNSFRPGTKRWERYKATMARDRWPWDRRYDSVQCKFRIVDLSTPYILPSACLNQRGGEARKEILRWYIYIYIDVINRIETVERERKIGCIKRHKRTIMI